MEVTQQLLPEALLLEKQNPSIQALLNSIITYFLLFMWKLSMQVYCHPNSESILRKLIKAKNKHFHPLSSLFLPQRRITVCSAVENRKQHSLISINSPDTGRLGLCCSISGQLHSGSLTFPSDLRIYTACTTSALMQKLLMENLIASYCPWKKGSTSCNCSLKVESPSFQEANEVGEGWNPSSPCSPRKEGLNEVVISKFSSLTGRSQPPRHKWWMTGKEIKMQLMKVQKIRSFCYQHTTKPGLTP